MRRARRPSVQRLLPGLLLAALLLGAWFARRAPGAGLGTSEVAYRARAVELALAGGGQGRDRYLAHPAGALAPCSPVSTRLLAVLARRAVGAADARGLESTGGVEEAELEWLLRELPPLGGLLASLAAFLALVRVAGPGAALAAAGVQALAPVWLVAERSGCAVVEPFAAALLWAQFGWLARVGRGRDLSDATLAGMLSGGCGGLALLLSSTSLPLVAGAGGLLLARAGTAPDERRADAWRALLLFLLAAVAVASLPPGGESTTTARALLGAATPGWWARALVPALALGAGLALRRGAARWTRLAPLGLLPALVWLGAPLRAAAAPRGPAELELLRGLSWMRAGTPSPGPFNHAAAAQDWCVLCPPELGAQVAYRARRPVVAADFPTASGGDGARAVRAAFAAEDSGAFALALRELGARYVLVAPGAARSPGLARLGPESAFARLARGEELPGLERVFASALPVECAGIRGPAVSIYRTQLAPRDVPRLSPVR